jgi:hypothetical protein
MARLRIVSQPFILKAFRHRWSFVSWLEGPMMRGLSLSGGYCVSSWESRHRTRG